MLAQTVAKVLEKQNHPVFSVRQTGFNDLNQRFLQLFTHHLCITIFYTFVVPKFESTALTFPTN